MKWILECTRMGERQASFVDRYESAEAAVSAAEALSPRGIHWTQLPSSRIGVAGDRQYIVRQEAVAAVR